MGDGLPQAHLSVTRIRRLYAIPPREPPPPSHLREQTTSVADRLAELRAMRLRAIPPREDAPAASAPAPAGGARKLAINALAGGFANVAKIGINLVMLPLMAHLL